ncbi:MAG: 4Fe-4S binding protein [Oscillospiraceae bacterium]|nr:4Fe-4S binding protein [Oscillospiraceae bacterium]
MGRRRRGPAPRRLIQLYAALLYNAHLRGFAEGKIYTGPLKSVCVPGLNCYSCPGAVAACPLGALQNAVAASADRPAFYVVGLLLLFGLLLGRVICGSLCPFGLLQELLYRIPVKKVRKSAVTRKLIRLKYGILAVFAVAVPAWFALRRLPLPAFCKFICPAGTLEGAVLLLLHPGNGELRAMTGGLFVWKLAVLVLVLAACVFAFRAFCRFLCPLGAIYSLMSRIALLGVKTDRTRCTGCGACVRVCRMDIRYAGDGECVHCGDCISACPEKAISFRAGKIVLRGPDIPERRERL